MTIETLIQKYETKKIKYGKRAFKYISSLLQEAKEQHKRDFLQSSSAKKAIEAGRYPDHEQSWRAFKGKNLEKLIAYIITDEVHSLGLSIVNGNTLERTLGHNLSKELGLVKRNLLIDYGPYGSHLPDVDLVVYQKATSRVVAVLSSKVTLRERIAQTGYWKMKLALDQNTAHIKVFFVTPDEDGTLTIQKPMKKGRAIVEMDTDGGYVLSEAIIEESSRVKSFSRFIQDLKKIS